MATAQSVNTLDLYSTCLSPCGAESPSHACAATWGTTWGRNRWNLWLIDNKKCCLDGSVL